jgi:hypothetical protein
MKFIYWTKKPSIHDFLFRLFYPKKWREEERKSIDRELEKLFKAVQDLELVSSQYETTNNSEIVIH